MNGVGYGITPFMGASGILARSSGGGGVPFVNEYSMSLDGVDEYFTAGNPSSLQITGAFTLSAWVKRDSTATSNNYQIIGKDNVFSARCYSLGINTATNQARFNIWRLNIEKNVIGTTVLSSDVWYHIMAVNDGTDLKIYVNGVLDGTNVGGGGTIDNDPTNFNIGSRDAGVNSGYWNGKIDEVAVWNTDQSSNVSTIYNGGAPADLTSLSPLSWWRMGDGDTWNGSIWTLTDNGSGGNDATSVFMEEADRLPISPNSYSQNSFSFDGIDEYLISNIDGRSTGGVLASLDTDVEMTFSLWFKVPSLPASLKGIFQWGSQLNDSIPFLLLQLQPTGNIRILVDNGYRLTQSISTGVWYNIVITRTANNNTWTFYLNGSSLGTYDDGGTITNRFRALSIYLGNGYNGYFNGNIDEVAIWNTDQSSNISTIFNNGVPQDISSLSPLSHWRMGENATWNGSTWTLTDQGSGGNNATSVFMEEADKTGDQAYVI